MTGEVKTLKIFTNFFPPAGTAATDPSPLFVAPAGTAAADHVVQ